MENSASHRRILWIDTAPRIVREACMQSNAVIAVNRPASKYRHALVCFMLLAMLSACGSVQPTIACRASSYNPAISMQSDNLVVEARRIFHIILISQGFESGQGWSYTNENVCNSSLIEVATEEEHLVELDLSLARSWESSNDHIRMVNRVIAALEVELDRRRMSHRLSAVSTNRN